MVMPSNWFYLVLLLLAGTIAVGSVFKISEPFGVIGDHDGDNSELNGVIDNYKEKSEVKVGTLGYTYFQNWGPDVNMGGPGIVNSTTSRASGGTRNQFGNFGTIGNFPAVPLAKRCKQGAKCKNFTFNGMANVCTECEGLAENYNDLSAPIYVHARSAGRPRQMKQIVNYI